MKQNICRALGPHNKNRRGAHKHTTRHYQRNTYIKLATSMSKQQTENLADSQHERPADIVKPTTHHVFGILVGTRCQQQPHAVRATILTGPHQRCPSVLRVCGECAAATKSHRRTRVLTKTRSMQATRRQEATHAHTAWHRASYSQHTDKRNYQFEMI
jgi:hypothetical protein